MGIGRLFHIVNSCSKNNYIDAAKEIVTTMIASLLPLWLGLLMSWPLKNISPNELINNFFESNEALLVSAALVGPLIYTISRKYGDFPHSLKFQFPYALFFLLIAFIICVVAAGMFGLSVAYSGSGSGTSAAYIERMDVYITHWLSVTILGLSTATLFLVSSFRNQLDSGPTKQMRSDTDKLFDQWRSE